MVWVLCELDRVISLRGCDRKGQVVCGTNIYITNKGSGLFAMLEKPTSLGERTKWSVQSCLLCETCSHRLNSISKCGISTDVPRSCLDENTDVKHPPDRDSDLDPACRPVSRAQASIVPGKDDRLRIES